MLIVFALLFLHVWFAWIGQGGDGPVLQNVVVQLENENVDDDVTPARVAHLYPADCTNIMSAMKSMIQGFISGRPGGLYSYLRFARNQFLSTSVGAKPRSNTSLAAYDIELLKAWYAYDMTEQGRLHLAWVSLPTKISIQRAHNSLF